MLQSFTTSSNLYCTRTRKATVWWTIHVFLVRSGWLLPELPADAGRIMFIGQSTPPAITCCSSPSFSLYFFFLLLDVNMEGYIIHCFDGTFNRRMQWRSDLVFCRSSSVGQNGQLTGPSRLYDNSFPNWRPVYFVLSLFPFFSNITKNPRPAVTSEAFLFYLQHNPFYPGLTRTSCQQQWILCMSSMR